MKNIILILLLCLCCVLLVCLNLKHKALQQAILDSDTLNADLKRIITIKGRTIQHKVRVCNHVAAENVEPLKNYSKVIADSKIKSDSYYIPPEGSFSYVEDLKGGYKLDVDYFGFTFKPYIGFSFQFDGKVAPLAGVRLFYYSRWGIGGLYCASSGLMAAVERRADDFLPFDNMAFVFSINKNTAAVGAVVFL